MQVQSVNQPKLEFCLNSRPAVESLLETEKGLHQAKGCWSPWEWRKIWVLMREKYDIVRSD